MFLKKRLVKGYSLIYSLKNKLIYIKYEFNISILTTSFNLYISIHNNGESTALIPRLASKLYGKTLVALIDRVGSGRLISLQLSQRPYIYIYIYIIHVLPSTFIIIIFNLLNFRETPLCIHFFHLSNWEIIKK